MKILLSFLFGACAAAVAGFAMLLSSSHGFSANEKPSAVETWFARRVRTAAVPSDARSRTNPVAESPDTLADARAHWADHCAGCHANDGSGQTAMGRQSYPPAPDMRLASTQQMTDGELFYIIQNGIRFSGMPAWSTGSAHDEQDSWKLVRFIRHLPNMTADEKHQMEGMNPRTPDEFKEEQEEEAFLKGADTHEPQPKTHHH